MTTSSVSPEDKNVMSLLIAGFLLLQTPTVTIAWDPSDTPSVWYNVYRSTSPLGPWVKLNEERIGYFQVELEYTDLKPILGSSYYTITAENEGGESDKSDVIPVSLATRPQPPRNPRRK